MNIFLIKNSKVSREGRIWLLSKRNNTAKYLKINQSKINHIEILKKSIDARKKILALHHMGVIPSEQLFRNSVVVGICYR